MFFSSCLLESDAERNIVVVDLCILIDIRHIIKVKLALISVFDRVGFNFSAK